LEQGHGAALVEHISADVFSTSVGNIPPDATVVVEITYLNELKHDSEADALRLTIPTAIAPRYGHNPANGLPQMSNAKIELVVQVLQTASITSVSSPSHTISMQLGTHELPDKVSKVVPRSAAVSTDFDPKKAIVTLAVQEQFLDKDFVLLIKSQALSEPTALLEEHASLPHHCAIMLNLMPKFSLPLIRPEIVFVVDRSGSMRENMTSLKIALGIFLKSLPVGVKFNICSFGSRHHFLWPKSKSYGADSLAEAEKYVATFEADFGGTEMLLPIKAAYENRFSDLALEILVLTDGAVWDTQQIFDVVAAEAQAGVKKEKGASRLFTLGLGDAVSHHLVEGLARSGNGYCQIVTNKEAQGGLLLAKIVRMLKASLSPHIHNYKLILHPTPQSEDFEIVTNHAPERQSKEISLFDSAADPDKPQDLGRFGNLPSLSHRPHAIQAPFNIPPLFPFSRTIAYILLPFSKDYKLTSVELAGDMDGTRLTINLPITKLESPGETLHQLAARAHLRDLEEGHSFIHSGEYGVDAKKNEGNWDQIIAREGIAVGMKYKVSSKWTSFVSIEEAKHHSDKRPPLEEEKEETEVGDDFFIVPRAKDCKLLTALSSQQGKLMM
jgi:hypothetical protein